MATNGCSTQSKAHMLAACIVLVAIQVAATGAGALEPGVNDVPAGKADTSSLVYSVPDREQFFAKARVDGAGSTEEITVAAAAQGATTASEGTDATAEGDIEDLDTGARLETPSADEWYFDVGAYLWWSRSDSTVTMGDTEVDASLKFTDILDDLAFAGIIYFEGHKGKWGFFVDAFYVKTKDTMDVLFLKIDTQEEQFLVEAGPLYRLFDDGDKSLEVFVGGRVFILSSDIDIYPLSIEDEHDWVEPFFGGRFRKRLSDKWTFGTRMHIGGFGIGSELTAGAQAIFAYDVTPRTTLGFGYRYQYLDYDGDDFGMESHMHGPLVGAIYRF